MISNIIIDDIVLPDGVRRAGVLGGAATYSAIGAASWWPQVTIVAGVGGDLNELAGGRFARLGLRDAGLLVRDPHTIRNHLVYLADGERTETPMLGIEHFDKMQTTPDDVPDSLLPAAATYFFRDASPNFWQSFSRRRAQLGTTLWEWQAGRATPAAAEAAPAPGSATPAAGGAAPPTREGAAAAESATPAAGIATPATTGFAAAVGSATPAAGIATPTTRGGASAVECAASAAWPSVRSFLPTVDMFSLTLSEARDLLGTQEPHDIVSQLLLAGANVIVLRMGAAGALIADRRTRLRLHPPGSRVVDVTGAGNAFCGGFLAGWCKTHDLESAARAAAAAAAQTMLDYGPPERIDHESLRALACATTITQVSTAITQVSTAITQVSTTSRRSAPPSRTRM